MIAVILAITVIIVALEASKTGQHVRTLGAWQHLVNRRQRRSQPGQTHDARIACSRYKAITPLSSLTIPSRMAGDAVMANPSNAWTVRTDTVA